jgi:hypothetical protein
VGRVLAKLEQIAHSYLKVAAKSVDGIKINASRCLLVEKRDGVAVESGIASHIADLQLSLPHQSGQVALDQDVLREKISFKMTKNT